MPIGCEQDLDRERLQPATLGRRVDLVDRRTQPEQSFDQCLVRAEVSHLGAAPRARSFVLYAHLVPATTANSDAPA